MREPAWTRLFPDEDFRWAMALRSGDAGDFWSRSLQAEEVLLQRRDLLANHRESCAVLPDAAADLCGEALALLSSWSGVACHDPIAAGMSLEPDWVLLRSEGGGGPRVEAGVVCFPTGWSLPEKVGRPLAAVHKPAPRLNASLGRKMGTFLDKLAPGAIRERENWGLSADEELDHHPRHARAALRGDEPLSAVWLRLERQLFARLPGGGWLFGIRVSQHRLDGLAAISGLGPRMARALRTMPAEIATYKRLAAARARLAETLETADEIR